MIDLIIFDCDGTLVDSEPIANGVFVECVNALGAALTSEEAFEHFVGTSLAYCMEYTATTYGIEYPPNFIEDYRQRSAQAFRSDLKPINHAGQLLAKLSLPMCVASNGPLDTMRTNLETVGLLHFFGSQTFSAYTRQIWKPDPDLFLHAAAQFNIPPSKCLVIEDSSAGVQAAQAAKMHVLGYRGPNPGHRAEFHGAREITNLLEVLDFLNLD